jgi:hypothetical protein
MKNYENVYHVLGLPPVALDVALGKIPLPLADASAPYSVYGFPPALIPMYSESSGPLYCGFWKHHFAERASTIVSLSVEAGYRAREIARNVDQLFAHIVLVAIGVHDGISPEIERFAAGVGIRDLAAFDRMSMDCGDSLLHLRGRPPFDRQCPLASYEDPSDYDGDFPSSCILESGGDLRGICALEVSRELQQAIASRPDAPPWFTTRDQAMTCRELLDIGDLRGAWMSLNSPGWLFPDAKRALRALADKACNAELSVVAEAWIAELHEHAGGY